MGLFARVARTSEVGMPREEKHGGRSGAAKRRREGSTVDFLRRYSHLLRDAITIATGNSVQS